MKYFCLLLCVFCFAFPCMADDTDGTYSIFFEDFEYKFPPDSWNLVKTNPNHTWEKVNSAAEGEISAWGRDYFAYVHGNSEELYDESLITTNIINKYNESCFVDFGLVCEPDFLYQDDFDLSIDLSINYNSAENPSWTTLASLKNENSDALLNCDPVTSGTDLWRHNETMPDIVANEFWLRFRYSGTSGTGVGLDHIYVSCINEHSGPDYGNYGDDDTPDDDSDKKKEEDCNCGLTFHDPAAPLAFFMVLIGIVSLLISKRRFHL